MEHLAYGMKSSVTICSYATKSVICQHDLLHTALRGSQVLQDPCQQYKAMAIKSRKLHVQE